MINKIRKKHYYIDLYNKFAYLTRDKILYLEIFLQDKLTTRIYLILFHLSFFLKFQKNKGYDKKKLQFIYDFFFKQIENNLREDGFGDITVNKKMKNIINLFNEILLYCDTWENIDKNKKNNFISEIFNETSNKNFNVNKMAKYLDNFNKFTDYKSFI
tara:strand:- start:116 stop:589 length:474 start_codon:yes stop_codon:yes gene_type:complete